MKRPAAVKAKACAKVAAKKSRSGRSGKSGKSNWCTKKKEENEKKKNNNQSTDKKPDAEINSMPTFREIGVQTDVAPEGHDERPLPDRQAAPSAKAPCQVSSSASCVSASSSTYADSPHPQVKQSAELYAYQPALQVQMRRPVTGPHWTDRRQL